MLRNKLIAAGVGVLTVATTVVPSAYAQDELPLPPESGAQEVLAQEGEMTAHFGPKQGNKFGQMKGKFKEGREQFENLTLEEKKDKLSERLDKVSEHISDRIEKVTENEDMDSEVKTQLLALLNGHLSSIPSYKDQVAAAADDEALKAVMEAMREDAKAVFEFMKENRPTKEEMQAKWDSLSFEEKQEKILSNLDRAIEHLNEKLANIDASDIDDERKTEIKEHMTERLAEITANKDKVSAATSDEDLEALKEELKPKKRGHDNGHRGGQGGPQGQGGPMQTAA